MVFDPAKIPVTRLDAVLARDLDGHPSEAFAQRVTVGSGIVRMDP